MDNPIGVVSCHLSCSSIQAACEKARAIGLDAIEWFEGDQEFISDPAVADEVAVFSSKYGITNSYHAPFMDSWDIGRMNRPGTRKTFEAAITCCDRMNARLITFHPGTFQPGGSRSAALEAIIGGLEDSLKLAAKLGVRISLENLTRCYSETALGDRVEDFDFIFERVGSEWVGLNLDVGHAKITNNFSELLASHGKRLINTHLNDTDGTTDGHLPPGEGTVDFPGFLGKVQALGYRGPFNLEFPEASGAYKSFIATLRSF
ncbi:MAG: sugar phosphate isomerase/epimerase family protein [Planctomycetota bacterium]|nr:sugar phosphate isomerase/epimerase family protein [Planctomycetota bacterium]